jgi:hypothetical protein
VFQNKKRGLSKQSGMTERIATEGKEQMLAEQLEVKEAVNRELLSVTVIEVKTKERIPQ